MTLGLETLETFDHSNVIVWTKRGKGKNTKIHKYKKIENKIRETQKYKKDKDQKEHFIL